MEKKHLKIGAYLLMALIAVLIIMYVVKYVKKKFAELETQHITPYQAVKNAVAAPSSTYIYGNAFPLKLGSSGTNVVSLQMALNKYGKYGLAVDGRFGPKTKTALQSALGISSITKQQLEDYANKNATTTTKDYFSDGGNSGSWEGGANEPVTSYPTDLRAFAIEVKTDLDTPYIFSTRGNKGVWAQMVMLKENDLKTVANYIKTIYGESLYALIQSARFGVSEDIDTRILNKLKAAGISE